MDYIGWLIAAIVLGMLTYPFLQLIPDKRQKRQVAFRQAAMQKGINIQIRHPDLPPALASQYPALLQCAAYYKPEKSLLTNNYIAVRSNNNNDWFWLNERRPHADTLLKMLALYQELPAFCLAIEQNATGSTLFLQDAMEPGQIDAVEDALNKLNALISQ